MEKEVVHTFITARPKIISEFFKTWRGPLHPVIHLECNQKVKEESAMSHLYFEAEGGIAVTAIQGEKGEGYGENMHIVAIEPGSELPLNCLIHLKVKPGLVSEEGLEAGIEDRTLVTFYTFPEFTFLGLAGCDNNGNSVILPPDSPDMVLLNPLREISLLFSSPVPARLEGPKLTITPDLAGGRSDYNPWASLDEGDTLQQPHHQGNKYPLSLPERLKAYQKYKIKSSLDFQDAFGRVLPKPLDFTFRTDHRPPTLAVKNKISVLEKYELTHLPLTITNLSQIKAEYRLFDDPQDFWYLGDLAHCDRYFQADQNVSYPAGAAEDIAYVYPLKIREMLSGQSGALAGVLSAEPPTRSDCTIKFLSQVTNLATHVKLGHHNTIVWVTRLDNGLAVNGAKVEFFFSSQPAPLTSSLTNDEGIAYLEGTKTIDPYLERLRGNLREGFGVIRITTEDDSALLPLIWEFEDDVCPISGEGEFRYYGSFNWKKYSHMLAWGTTSQGVYRVGDAIDYKIYVRDQDNRRLIQPELSPYRLEVTDPSGKVVHEVANLTLSEFGSFHNSFSLPKGSLTGWYNFHLSASFGQKPQWWPMRVLVTDFTPAPFQVKTDLNAQLFRIGDQVEVLTTARLHSGGPYGQTAARVTATLTPLWFNPDHPRTQGFIFTNYDEYGIHSQQIFQEEKELDEQGDLKTLHTLQDSGVIFGKLTIESAVRDDRGKFVTSTATARYLGRDRLVGLRHEQWGLKEDEAAEFQVMVVNEKDEPMSGTEISVTVEYDRVTGSRVKGAGDAYLVHYQHTREEVNRFTFTSTTVPLSGRFTPKEPGSYYLTAKIKDTAGWSHSASMIIYVAGKGEVLWESPNDNSLKIIPAEKEYKVGDKAKFMVQNPYPGARALVSIERFGVIKSWTETFSTNSPIIEFEIEPDFVPGFYLSVVIHACRVEKPLQDNEVDLGKPSFKIGYLAVPVVDPHKRLTITAQADKEVYAPGHKVTLTLEVSDLKRNHPKAEVAIVVLDEAILDLIQGGVDYYDPYKGFYQLDSLDMRNYNLLTHLVGRQRFEKKGANAGGGGGGLDFQMRSNFTFVSYWNPQLYPDPNGRLSLTFTLPDNLTTWRVLALAVTKDDLMGLGSTRFAANKYTEIRPALPNQVTEGDLFQAAFTILNRTDKLRHLTVKVSAAGDALKAGSPARAEEIIKAEPYVRNKVYLPVLVEKSGEITFTIAAGDDFDQDGLSLPLTVHKKQTAEAVTTYGTTTAARVSENFEFPIDMQPDTGKVSVVVSPSIISSLEGAFAYMKQYPYSCWEQKLSMGVMARQYLTLRPCLADSFTWEEAEKVIRQMLKEAPSYQAPNGGMCYYVAEDRYVCPYLSAYTALALTWLKEEGYSPESSFEARLHQYLQDLLHRDVFPTFFSTGMSSTVRAVALAALAPRGKASRQDLDRYAPHLEQMDLFGKAHYLLAATFIKDTDEIQARVYQLIMNHAHETGGKVIFTESVVDEEAMGRINSSEMRTNAAILSALLAMEEYRARFPLSISADHQASLRQDTVSGGQQALLRLKQGDTPGGHPALLKQDTAFKIVRYLTQTRKKRDHWENTQENVFCTQALSAFSRIYDREPPHYTVSASLDQNTFGQATFDDLKDSPQEFGHATTEHDPGRQAALILAKEGPGRLYYAARLFYAPKELPTESINSGIEVHREYYVERKGQWIQLGSEGPMTLKQGELAGSNGPMRIKQGELVRVELFISLPAARNFVVVADPVPGGLEPVNRDLATASTVDTDKELGVYSDVSWWFKPCLSG